MLRWSESITHLSTVLWLAVAGVLAVILFSNLNLFTQKNMNLLHTLDWSHIPGVTSTPEGLLIQPLDRIIIHQDGSAGQANPPVLLNGPHLQIKGDFRLTARLQAIDGQALLRLYNQPPIVYDQWRYETPSLEIGISKDKLTTRLWDGSASNPIDKRIQKINLINKTSITIERQGEEISLSLNERQLETLPSYTLFKSGQLWLGLDAGKDGKGWQLNELHLESLRGGEANVILAPAPTLSSDDAESLRNLSQSHPRKIYIGAAVSLTPLMSDTEYRQLALTEFSSLTPENSMKPQFLQPQPNRYVFTEADALVEIALQNNMIVHGHTLVYTKSSPDWMTKSAKQDRQMIMTEHIKNVVSHFRGRVAEWDVVNEALSDKNKPYNNNGSGLESTIWFEAMGEKYLDIAFRTAHEADPDAVLYLNDYGLENDGKRWDALLRLVRRLKQRGVPIHGVGFEAHVYKDSDYINMDSLRSHMRSLAALGLKVRISEIDVTGDEPEEQINQYVNTLDVCLQEENCTSYTSWGITDRYGSTTRSDRYPLVYGTSLLWDKDFKAKPVYQALQQRLQQK